MALPGLSGDSGEGSLGILAKQRGHGSCHDVPVEQGGVRHPGLEEHGGQVVAKIN